MKRHIICIICCLAGWQIQAQEPLVIPPNISIDEGIVSYMDYVGNQAVIYTGKEEAKYPTYILNHPYLDTNQYRKGTLGFDGLVYPNVKLRLNQNTEELIILSPDERFNTIVPTDRVDFAYIDSFYIFYNRPNSGVPLPEGYYAMLHNGKYPVLKRETMFLSTTTKDMTIESSFVKRTRVYIYKDGKYNQVSSKRSVLKLLGSKKKELNRLIKLNRINFRNSPSDAIVAVVKLYEYLE